MIDLYPVKANRFVNTLNSSSNQSISVTDLISEGPIYGLVDGQASVFLNDDRVSNVQNSALHVSSGPMTITLDNGSTTATISGNTVPTPILSPTTGKKYLVIRAIATVEV